jgi:hypothetical protein
MNIAMAFAAQRNPVACLQACLREVGLPADVMGCESPPGMAVDAAMVIPLADEFAPTSQTSVYWQAFYDRLIQAGEGIFDAGDSRASASHWCPLFPSMGEILR